MVHKRFKLILLFGETGCDEKCEVILVAKVAHNHKVVTIIDVVSKRKLFVDTCYLISATFSIHTRQGKTCKTKTYFGGIQKKVIQVLYDCRIVISIEPFPEIGGGKGESTLNMKLSLNVTPAPQSYTTLVLSNLMILLSKFVIAFFFAGLLLSRTPYKCIN